MAEGVGVGGPDSDAVVPDLLRHTRLKDVQVKLIKIFYAEINKISRTYDIFIAFKRNPNNDVTRKLPLKGIKPRISGPVRDRFTTLATTPALSSLFIDLLS